MQVRTQSWDPNQAARPRRVLRTAQLPGLRWPRPRTVLPRLRCLGLALPARAREAPGEERAGCGAGGPGVRPGDPGRATLRRCPPAAAGVGGRGGNNLSRDGCHILPTGHQRAETLGWEQRGRATGAPPAQREVPARLRTPPQGGARGAASRKRPLQLCGHRPTRTTGATPQQVPRNEGERGGGGPTSKARPKQHLSLQGQPGGGVPPQLGSGPPLRVPPPAARACRPPGAPPTTAWASPLHCGPAQPLPDLSRGSEHLPGQQPDRPPDLPPLPLSSSGRRHIILSGTRAKSPETTAAWLGSPTLRSGPAPHTAAEPPRKHRSDAALPGPGASPGSKSLEAEDAEPPPCPLMPAPPAPLGCSHTGALGRPLAKQSSRARLKIQNRPLAGKLLFIPHDPTHRAQPTKHQGRLVTLLLCPACPRYLFLPHSHHLLPQKESRDHIRPVNLSSTLTPGDLP